MTTPPSQGSSSSNGRDAFHSYPQKFPKARVKAATVVSHIHKLTQKGPRSLVGTVVDTSFHVTQGYILCTTQLGIVKVFSVPYGSVVPQMRVFCRQVGGSATNKGFVFDGYAPNLSGLGRNGSFMYATPIVTLTTGLALTNTTGMPTTGSITSIFGYFWYWFFYLPQLPSSIVTLWQMTASSGSNVLTAEYLQTGQLRVRSQDGHGYISSGPLAPHNLHWIVMQPGVSPQSLLIDGVTASYNGITGFGDNPVFGAAGTAYQLSLLSNKDGTNLCPIGSWISKFGFGTAWTGSTEVTLQGLGTGLNGDPTDDSELPTAVAQSGVTLLYQLLCGDAVGSTTLGNTAAGAGTAATITTGGAVLPTGPY